MAPNLFGNSATLYLEASQQDVHKEKSTTESENNQKLLDQKSSSPEMKYEWNIVWRNVIAFLYLHLGAVYGLYQVFNGTKLYTTLWGEWKLIYTSFYFVENSQKRPLPV